MFSLGSRALDALRAFERDRTTATLRLAKRLVPIQTLGLVAIAAIAWRSETIDSAILAQTTAAMLVVGGVAFSLAWRHPQRERLIAAIAQAMLTVAVVELGGLGPVALGAAMFSLALLALLDDWRMTAIYAVVHTAGISLVHLVAIAVGRDVIGLHLLLEVGFVAVVALPVSLRCYLSAAEQRRLSTAAEWLEEQFESVQEREIAAQANEAKTEFLANMSHEIRTPLTAIRGFAELLGDRDTTEEERESHLITIRRNTDHLLTIINDILDLSKIEAGKMSVESLVTEPAAIVSDVLSLMRVRAAEKGIDFGARYETPVPQKITTDPTRLRQILLNLVSNAIKFTEQGGVEIRVRFSEAPTSMLAFEVRDSGIGLSEEQRSRLFEAFSQADTSTTRKFGGTGLGLVISQQMAQMLGGAIVVESERGVGSSFIASIATGDVQQVPRDAMFIHSVSRECDASKRAAQVDCTGARVLLAEDGLDNQRLIGTLIRKAGATIDIVDNGAAALARALEQAARFEAYDVVFMDMQMPIMDGYTATAKLREAGYQGEIVALTAHAMATERQRCLDAGCSAFLSKPVNRVALLETIRSAHAARGGADTSTTARRPSLGLPVVPQQATLPRPTPSAAPIHSSFADDPDYAPLITEFVARLADIREEVRDAFDSQNYERVRTLAHQMKGAGGGYGFDPISDAARTLENVMKTDEHEAQARALEAFLDVLARVTAPDVAAAA
jgi:signal transduction histidine kinase/DNA-binding NarL/FixJ family response regulator/HPt (histidine-containing phosphotransfer) domain-containing protein